MPKGFTLLELMIVLALIALASAMVVPRLYHNEALTIKADARQIIAMLKHARRLAMLRGQEIEVPIVFQKTEENSTTKTKTLIFFPTGGAKGQDLFHCHTPAAVLIKLDNITGKISPEFSYDNTQCQAPKVDPDFANYTHINVAKTKQQYQQKIQLPN